MVESRGVSRTGRAWAAALTVVAVTALLAGVYLIDRLLGLPGRAVESGREIALELRDLAFAFHQGKVETAFVGYAGQLSANNKLQVAQLRQVEVFRTANGKPELRLYKAAAERARELGVTQFHVSLTHQPGTAAAVVILEG